VPGPRASPHASRHARGVELLKRNGGNLRVVQEHLRHQDIGTTVTYTPLAQHELQKPVSVFDTEHGNNGTQPAPPRDRYKARVNRSTIDWCPRGDTSPAHF
jgi:hypothetical protein